METNNTKHTPGPWRVAGIGKPFTAYEIATADPDPRYNDGDRDLVIADIRWEDDNGVRLSEDEQLSNARLIAAAPELLKKLKRAEHLLDAVGRFFKEREGEGVGDYSIFYDGTDCDSGVLGEDCAVAAEGARALLAEIEGAQ